MLKIFTKKNIMISLIILFLGAVLYISFGFLPVLKVEGTLVGYAEFQKVNGAIGAFDKISRKSVSPPEEIKKMALESIIESRLLDELILEANPELAKKAEEILQRTLRGNKNLSFWPKKKKAALTYYYKPNPNRRPAFWPALLKTAKVKIYYPGFYWENG